VHERDERGREAQQELTRRLVTSLPSANCSRARGISTSGRFMHGESLSRTPSVVPPVETIGNTMCKYVNAVVDPPRPCVASRGETLEMRCPDCPT